MISVFYRCAGCGDWVGPPEVAGIEGHVVEFRNGHGDDYQEMCGPVVVMKAEERAAVILMGNNWLENADA